MVNKEHPNQLSNEYKEALGGEATDDEIKAHFKHMCESGMDPLLCVNRLCNWVNPLVFNGVISQRAFCNHHDKVIDEERYIELLHRGKVKRLDLDDIIYVPADKVLLPDPTVITAKAAIFWLYPSGCRTLTQLFNKYEKKIKNELKIDKSSIILPR